MRINGTLRPLVQISARLELQRPKIDDREHV